MAITDFLIGSDGIDRQLTKAKKFASEKFDPSDLSPQLDLYTDRAREGIDDELESTVRERTVQSLFGRGDVDIYGGQTARAIAGENRRSQQQSRALGDFESRLTEADIQAQQEGEAGVAQTRSKQKQLEGQRESAIAEAEMQAQAEKNRRKKQLAGAVGKIAGTIAGTAFGPLGAAGVGSAVGALGGAEGAVAGGLSGATTAMQFQMMDEARGAEEVAEETPETLLDAGSLAGMGVEDLARSIPENMSGSVEGQPFGGFEEMESAPEESSAITPQESSRNVNNILQTMGYNADGRKIGSEQPQQSFDFDSLMGVPDYLKPLNFEGDGNQVRKPRQRLGERVFGGMQESIDQGLGPAFGIPFRLGTLGLRTGMNVGDLFVDQYMKTLEEEPQPQGIFE